MTVLESIQRSTDFLARKGVESPRLQIELLLAHVLQLPRLKLYLNFERALTGPEIETLRELVRRRGAREPLQHLLGTVNFCGLELEVSREVLVPRPETEQLAVLAREHLAGLGGTLSRPPVVLDFGTGSGCVAICLARHELAAEVHGCDLSEAALAVARRNAARHGLADRLHLHLGDGFGALPAHLRFDLLVSNPPYIPSGDIASLEPEVRDFDPRLALDGGPDGLDFFRRLAAEAPAFLRPRARLLAEFGDGQGAGVTALFERAGWKNPSLEPDLAGRPRFMIAHRGE